MWKRGWLGVLLLAFLVGGAAPATTVRRLPAWPTLSRSAQSSTARVARDEFGRPSIEAETAYDLYEAYGYVVAEDRLWQLEVFRRAAKGRLAEVLGSLQALGQSVFDLDVEQRREGYTEQEYQQIFDDLPTATKVAVVGYRDGINRYLTQWH